MASALVIGSSGGCGRLVGRAGRRRSPFARVPLPRQAAGGAAQQQERHGRQARAGSPAAPEAAVTPRARGIGAELAEHGDVGAARDAGLRDQQAGRDRDDQARDLRDEPVADGEQGVGVRRLAEADAHLRHADEQPADQIDRR